ALVARLRALRRRSSDLILRTADLTIDGRRGRAYRAGKLVGLSPKESAVLEMLAAHLGRVVTRQMILEQVWGYTFETGTNLVEVHIAHLRKKLGPGLIQTVRNKGYRFDPPLAEE